MIRLKSTFKSLKAMAAVTGALTLAVAFSVAGGTDARAQALGFATSNPGSLYHSSGSAIVKMATEKTDMKLAIQPFASATIYLPAVNAGEYDFGISNVEELRVAVTGQEQFKGRPYKDLRAVAIMYPLRVTFFVRNDSDIKTMGDLKGKRVTTGYTSQKTIPPLINAQLETAGLTVKDVKGVRVPNVVAGANAFIQGKADAFQFALGAAKVREAHASVDGGIRAIGIPNTPENEAILKKHFPPSYLKAERPHPANPGVQSPIHVMTYDAAVVASTKTSEDAVYNLAKAMHANKKAMASVFPVFNLFNPDRMNAKMDPIQWHPGAVKFYKEQGMWPPK